VTNTITKLLNNYPKTIFFITLSIIIAFLPQLKNVEEQYGSRIWYASTDPLIKQLDKFERTFGNDELVILAVYKESGLFDTETLEYIRKLTEDAWEIADVIRVDSISNYNYTFGEDDDINIEPFFPEDAITESDVQRIKKLAFQDKRLINYLISQNGKMVIIYANLRPLYDGGRLDYGIITKSAKDLVKKIPPPKGVRVIVSGMAPVTDAYKTVSREDLGIILPILVLTIVGFLFYTFRSKVGVVLPICIIILSVICTFSFFGFVNYSFNNLSSTIPGILTAICIADTVHILATFFMSYAKNGKVAQSVKVSLRKNLGPTILTTISTAIGFGTLYVSEIIPIKELGASSAFGTGVAWFLTIFLLCPLFFMLPTKIFDRQTVRKGNSQFFTKKRSQMIVSWIFKFRKIIVIGFILTSAFCVYLASKNEVSSDPLKYFAKDYPIRVDFAFIRKNLNGIRGPEIVIHSEKTGGVKDIRFLEKVVEFDAWINKHILKVTKTISVVDIVKQMNKVFNGGKEEYYKIPDSNDKVAQFLFLYSLNLPAGQGLSNIVSVDYESLRLTLFWNIKKSHISLEQINKINAKAKEMGLKAYVSGQMPMYQRLNGYVVRTFTTSMTWALILVTLFMMFAFRSIKLGILSMFPNVIPITFGAGLMYLRGTTLDIGTAINVSVCLGVVVDDTIHFLFDYNRNRKEGYSINDSLVNVFINTAPALVLTTLILTVGFGLFFFSNFTPNVNFGLFCSVIFSFALIVDLIFLPALLLFNQKEIH